MPYKDPNYKKKYQAKYYKKWYELNGRNRAVDYAEAIQEWAHNNPEKKLAHRTVYRALLSGRLVKPLNCSQCHRKVRLSAHHEDYTKPLVVLWLCSSCHKIKHL